MLIITCVPNLDFMDSLTLLNIVFYICRLQVSCAKQYS